MLARVFASALSCPASVQAVLHAPSFVARRSYHFGEVSLFQTHKWSMCDECSSRTENNEEKLPASTNVQLMSRFHLMPNVMYLSFSFLIGLMLLVYHVGSLMPLCTCQVQASQCFKPSAGIKRCLVGFFCAFPHLTNCAPHFTIHLNNVTVLFRLLSQMRFPSCYLTRACLTASCAHTRHVLATSLLKSLTTDHSARWTHSASHSTSRAPLWNSEGPSENTEVS